jgi:CDP-glucose 4,6-dehydratase
VIRGERPIIRSDGTYVRDYFYVEDGAATYLELAEALAGKPELRGESFNFSNESPMTVIEVVDRVLKLMGSDLKPEIRNEATNEIRAQYLSAEKARTRLDWAPLFTMEEGLTRTISWYRDFFRRAA